MKIGLGAELKMVEGKLEALEKEKPELLDEIDRLRDENDNYLRAVNAKNAELENSCRELNIVIAREQSYYKELIALRKICSVEKNELYSTRAKLVELYEHYQLLETQIETKNALFQFAESTERDLKQKIHDLEVNLKSKELISEKESSQRGLLDKANQEIEKLQNENKRLKEGRSNSYENSLIEYSITELEKLINWYDSETTKISNGNQAPKFTISPSTNEEKIQQLLQYISTIFTESLLIAKHFDELRLKYNANI